MCWCDKILVNVAAYVIPGQMCVCVCVCVVRSKQEPEIYSTPYTHLTMNYICGHIYQDFITSTHYYIVFYDFNNS